MLKLTGEQEEALGAINSAINANRVEKFLLYGVTGSGKTEVYIQAAADCLAKGKSSIVLVPEIGLTTDLLERFRKRFDDQIAVLHSGLTLKQRGLEWERIARGAARIVLGTRIALFAPVKELGLIIIDEEYEITYKQEKSPRYHTREVAFKLAEINQAAVVMGSATPSIETYYHAENGGYKKLILSNRIDNRPLPPVEVIDMREKGEFILSKRLKEELKTVISKGEQAILFINRRGFFTFVMCQQCGLSIECPKCSVILTYHSGDRKLHCNRCNYSSQAPIICPRCQSSSIKYFGTGTQRIEKEVGTLIPSARILRYDLDAVSRRGTHELLFKTFAEGKADVLIGTQLVTKGLDIANVTLVGVISADSALRLPDFRAPEHTFQLLTQVAGRAGRHHLPGKVIIQTHSPDHFVIQAAANHDYEGFYRQEIENRRELGYPPFSKLIGILVSGQNETKVIELSKNLEKFLEKRLAGNVLGPAPAPIPKIRGEYRYRILLKGKALEPLRLAVSETLEKIVVPAAVKITVDIEPMGMM